MKKGDFYAVFTTENSYHPYAHINIFFSYYSNNSLGNPRGIDDFKITCQIDQDSINESPKTACYGSKLCYIGELTFQNHKEISKILSNVEKKFMRLVEKFGYPEDFANYATLMANALGVTEFSVNGSMRPIKELKSHINMYLDQKRERW